MQWYTVPTRIILYFSCCLSHTVPPYSPEIEFSHDALTRLEAVMGVEIVSVLAELYSPLTSSSGVKLQSRDVVGNKIALPNPKKSPAQYVVEVMLQWSAGRSSRPPTWRQLLIVLRDIGLIQLSQQIEEFMKGKLFRANSSPLCVQLNHLQVYKDSKYLCTYKL